MQTDVLIAGAGPVGLAMAAELTRFGLSVRIVDKAAARTDKSKALVIWSRTLELLARGGSTAVLLNAGFPVTGANILAGADTLAHITFDGVASPFPFAHLIPQSDTERVLGDHLSSLGVLVARSTELLSFQQSPDAVTCTLRNADSSEETVTARWLIGCDGAHSTVRHQLGLDFHGDTMPTDWVLADVHLSGIAHPKEINILLHADGLLAIFPITGNRYRVIADVGPTASGDPRPDPTLAQVQAVLDRRTAGVLRASDPVWLSGFHINERKVDDYRVGRVFLAGDAAHIHSPAGGQGMNTGIQDACNLAWKLALVTRGLAASEPLLSSYSAERSPVAAEVLRGAGLLTQFGLIQGEFKQALRNHLASLVFGLSPVRHKMADELTELSVGYPDSPLNLDSHAPGFLFHEGPGPGERAPILPGNSGNSGVAALPPVGSGDTPRFVLFAQPSEISAPLLARYSSLVEPTLRPPFVGGGLWLVRPDGYVALAARHDAWGAVDAFLSRLLPA